MSLFALLLLFFLGERVLTSNIKVPKKTIWIDFDETISVNDTTEHLAKLTERCPCLQQAWKNIWNKYLEEHNRAFELDSSKLYFNEKCKPTFTLKDTATGKAIYVVERGICQLNMAESQLYADLNCAGVFAGLSEEMLYEHGRKVPALHSNVGESLQSFIRDEMDVHVLSLHWSDIYISGALCEHGVPVKNLKVHSNQLAMCGKTTSGPIYLTMINGIDKLNNFVPYVKELNGSKETVFIGDAIHDFPSMLYADLGIWVESQGKRAHDFTQKVLKHGGVNILELPKAESSKCPERKDVKHPRIYKTRSWRDIQYVIRNCNTLS